MDGLGDRDILELLSPISGGPAVALSKHHPVDGLIRPNLQLKERQILWKRKYVKILAYFAGKQTQHFVF